MSSLETRQNLVKISTASHLSGIRVETLRAWDKRGQLEPIQRVGNTRYYTPDQVERMKALNVLIQSGIGYSIGELCTKSDDEIHQLVAQLHASPGLHVTPELSSTSRIVVVGWRLMDLRDTKFENDELQTVAPNIEDVETFFRYLKRLEHDGLDAAVIELPSAWDLDYIDWLRTQIDEFDHSDCHLITVSFLNDPDSFRQYQNEAKQKGVSLLDGSSDLTWETVLTEIKHALTMRNEAVGDSNVSLSASELARLAKSTHRIAGIAVADVVSLYQSVADMRGLAQRETTRQLLPNDPHATRFVEQLRSIHGELTECLTFIREATKSAPLDSALDTTIQ